MRFFLDQFDTEVFGSKVAKIFIEKNDKFNHLKKIDAFINNNKFNIVAIFTHHNYKLIHEIQLKNFRFIGTQCYLNLELAEPILGNRKKYNNGIILYSRKKVEPLLNFIDIIKNSSRWAKDNNVTSAFVHKYYSKWIINSINGYSDKIFVKKDKNKIVGLLSFKLTGRKKGKIDLLGVLENYQNIGIGKALIEYMKSFCFKNDIKKVEVVTELENMEALNFYINNGFSFTKYYLVFHKHFNNES